MLPRCLYGVGLMLIGLGALAWAQSAPPAHSPSAYGKRIGELIQRLGSSKFQERNAAQKELEAIGVPALEALKKSLASADLETSKRAGDLVRRIEEKALTSKLLAPKRVRLKVTDMPALEAVAELAQLSGYSIQFLGDRAKLANKKVTFDTGDVSFWEAFDRLCNEAGLVEMAQGQQGLNVNVNGFLPQGILPPRAVPVPPPALPIVPPAKPRPAPQIKANQNQANGPEANALVLRALMEAVALAQAQPPRVQPVPQPVPPPAPAVRFQLQKAVIGQAILDSPPQIHTGLLVSPGLPKNQHVSYAGAVRTRVYSAPGAKVGEYHLILDASAEPRLQGFTIVGTPTLTKALDEQGETLALVTEEQPRNAAVPRVQGRLVRVRVGSALAEQRQIQLHLKAGPKPAHTLKELSGSLTAQVLAPPEPLITLNNVLKSSGESVQAHGGVLRLDRIEKLANGAYKVQVHVDNPPSSNAAPGVILGNGIIQMQGLQVVQQIQVGVIGGAAPLNHAQGMPELFDAAGHKFAITQIPARRMSVNNGAVSQDLTIVYRGPDGAGEPERLVLHGSRAVTLTIPFSFKNVALD